MIRKLFILAILSACYVEVLAFDYTLGRLFSFLIFFVFIVLSIKDLPKGIVFLIFYSLTHMEYPRGILGLYEDLQVNSSVTYDVINTVKLGPLTLLVVLFLFNSVLALIKSKFRVVRGTSFISIFSMFIIATIISTTYEFIKVGYINFALMITNVKWFILIICGYIQGSYLYICGKDDYFKKIILILPLFVGIRTMIFLSGDVISGNISFDVMSPSFISMAISCYVLLNIKKDEFINSIYRNPFASFFMFFSLVNFSRLYMICLFLVFFAILIYSFINDIKLFIKLIICTVLFFLLTFFYLYNFNEELLTFITWKLNVFSTIVGKTDMSGSGQVRVIEAQNIIHILSTDPLQLLFGKGLLATYNFDYLSLNNVGIIDLKSFSDDQLTSGIYYTTHSFFNANLLKFGIFGLVAYLLLPIFHAIKVLKIQVLYSFLLFSMVLSYYWRLEHALLFGLIVAIASGLSKKLEVKYV